MPEPDAPPPLDEGAFDARAAALGLTLTGKERGNALIVARYLHAAAAKLRAIAQGRA